MVQILIDNPLLLLFVVAAIGYPLGQIKVWGVNLGVAAVLFAGLAVGALHPDLKLPEIVYQLGLVLFVYTIGLSSGSLFFTSLRRKGLANNLLVTGGLLLAALLAAVAHRLLGFKATLTAGMYAGSLTNTPALAAVLEHVKAAAPQVLAEPVIAYSLTYPVGVLGMILAIYILQRAWKIDYEQEAVQVKEYSASHEPLQTRTIQVTRPCGQTVSELAHQHHWNVIFGRIRHAGEVSLVTGRTALECGDFVSLVGTREALEVATEALGEISDERLEFDLSQYDKRRIIVSDPAIPGRRLRDLNLFERFGAVVTRVRRGDLEMLPHGDTVLSLGDQVRVVAPHENMDQVAAFLGDSYRAVSEIDILTFSLGLALGLLLGLAPIPLPGGVMLSLGLAGGPLIVALVLGTVGRTGPMVWELPYSANLTLRQIGLVLFLAGVGTRSGYAFISTLMQGGGLLIFAAGAAITCLTALLALWVGYRLLKIPMGLLTGILAGMQTQPAVLGFALEQTHNDLPNIGYATVYPVAMIVKIVLAQILLSAFL